MIYKQVNHSSSQSEEEQDNNLTVNKYWTVKSTLGSIAILI